MVVSRSSSFYLSNNYAMDTNKYNIISKMVGIFGGAILLKIWHKNIILMYISEIYGNL